MSAGYTSVRAEASKLLQPASEALTGCPRGYISFHDRGSWRSIAMRSPAWLALREAETTHLLHVRRIGSVPIALRKLV